jgi:hypothetical protein
MDWGFVVKLVLPRKVTRRAYKVRGIYDRFLTNVLFRPTNFVHPFPVISQKLRVYCHYD